MLFEQILGQQTIKSYLLQIIENDRVPHAMLFTGPPGTAKLPIALAFASIILCEKLKGNAACGDCAACRKNAQLIHPDLHFSFPTIGTNVKSSDLIKPWREAVLNNQYLSPLDWFSFLNAENKQGNINKDECIQAIKRLNLKSFESDKKVWIVWGAEYLGKEGNRLLKQIEEPTDNTFIILITDHLPRILNTIQSRCQLIKFLPYSTSEIADFLHEHHLVEREKALQLSRLSDGNLNVAIQLAKEGQSDLIHTWMKWFQSVIIGKSNEVLKLNDELHRIGRERQKQWVQFGLKFVEEMTRMQFLPQSEIKLFDKEIKLAQIGLSRIPMTSMDQLVDILNKLQIGIERNGNVKILLLDTYIQIKKLKSIQVAAV